jgi:hypothetical protein
MNALLVSDKVWKTTKARTAVGNIAEIPSSIYRKVCLLRIPLSRAPWAVSAWFLTISPLALSEGASGLMRLSVLIHRAVSETIQMNKLGTP